MRTGRAGQAAGQQFWRRLPILSSRPPARQKASDIMIYDIDLMGAAEIVMPLDS
jgi:hypothetical protein